MKRFRDLPIKNKLTFIILGTCALTIFLASAVFILNELFSFRKDLIHSTATLAQVTGINSTAALSFQDPKTAGEILTALNAEPHIRSARIYTKGGKIFASYTRETRMDSGSSVPDEDLPHDVYDISKHPEFSPAGYRFSKDHLDLVRPIILNDRILGQIFIRADLGRLYDRLKWFISVVVCVLLGSIFLAYLMSLRFQRIISDPISTLKKTMDTVSKDKDYSIRVENENRDELGTLFGGFNAMLSEIQARDERLLFTQFSIDHMGDAAFWMDSAANIIYVNNAACSALDYSCEELLCMTIHDIDPHFPKSRWQAHWDEIRYRKLFVFESNHIKKNGDMFPVEVYVNYLEFQGKEYNCAFARDISERRSLQLKLEQAKKMEAIGTLVGGVAHDLNNILGGLVSYPELLLLELPPGSQLRAPLEVVKRSGDRAAAIVQDMLTLSRTGVGLKEAVNLNEIVAEYFRSPEHDRISKFHERVEFDWNLEEGLPNILGSNVQLSKALMNLVVNAAESMQNKGNVLVSTSDRFLEKPLMGFHTIVAGHYAVLSVEDGGSGLLDEEKENIFEPFYTKKLMGRSGTGLGMTVVLGTVKDYNGFIDIWSHIGQGTRFDLYFPVTEQALQQKETALSAEDYKGREKILVVDDIKEQRDIAELVLSKLGYHVNSFSSGEDALEYLERNPVDLLVIDMIMEPGIDGLETYTRALALYPNQKAVIASGYAETDRVKAALSLGVGAYVKKPYTLEKLAIAVRGELDRQT